MARFDALRTCKMKETKIKMLDLLAAVESGKVTLVLTTMDKNGVRHQETKGIEYLIKLLNENKK